MNRRRPLWSVPGRWPAPTRWDSPSATTPRDRDEAHRGFTLIEVMVVVLLTGLALAVAVPSLPRTDPAASDAQAIVRSLRLARRSAAVRGRAIAVRFRLDEGVLETVEERPGAGQAHLISRDRITGDLEARPPHASPTVRFGPLGRAAGPRLIVRWDHSAREIEVDPWTGEVEVTVVD